MTVKQIPNSLQSPDGGYYVTLTDGNGNLVTAGGSGATSVSNVDGSLTISPTTGAVVASLNTTQPNPVIFPAGSATTPGLAVGVTGTGVYGNSTTLGFTVNAVDKLNYGSTNANQWAFGAGVQVNLNGTLQLGGSNILAFQSGNTQLTSNAANIFHFGLGDSSSPGGQTFVFQNVAVGTSNTAGANATIQGSLSTGSGVSGDILLRTGGTGAGATAQNAAVTALTIKGATQLVLTNTPSSLIGASTALNNGAAAAVATMTNGPTAGNPTKWVPINDAGTTRYIPAW